MKKTLIALLMLAAFVSPASFSLNSTVQYDPSLVSAFGTLETAELTPVVALDFIHGINVQTGVSNVLNSATIDTAGSRLRLQSGVNSAGSAIFRSKRPIKYRAGQGSVARFTAVFGAPQTNNLQEIGAGNELDGYFFGFNTNTQFGINFKSNGTNNWIPQSSWNGDKADGTGASGFNWNPTNGNVCMIKYPFLGFGDINFFVEDSNSARFILVHTIKYANTTQNIQVSNPNFYFYARNLNIGNTANVTMYSGSVGFFISGARSFASNPKWGVTSTFKAVPSGETNLITVQCATNFNGVVSRSLIRLNSITLSGTFAGANSGMIGAIQFNLRYSPTIGGTPLWTAVNGTTNAAGGLSITNGNSVATYDTSGTTISGGFVQFSFTLTGIVPQNNGGSAFSQVFDLSPYDLYVAPADSVSVSAQLMSGSTSTANNAAVALTWTEDL